MATVEDIKTSEPNIEIGRRDYSRRRVFGSEQEYGILVPQTRQNHEYASGYCFCCWKLKREGFLENGGLVYYDCSHPEYASPESSNPLDAVVYDKAGELIVQKEVISLAGSPRLFKNNVSVDGQSFASHESYSLRRSSMVNLSSSLLPFLTTRIIYTGAGSINENNNFELSQKARFTSEDVSSKSTGDKGIFNTRDESLTENKELMRLHVVSGDANLSEYALFLKYGTMGLVLDLFEDGKIPALTMSEKYVEVFHDISKNIDCKWQYSTDLGRRSPIEIQRMYLDKADTAYRGRDSVADAVLDCWDATLKALAGDAMQSSLTRQIDWVIKKNLIDGYIKRTRKSMNDKSVRNIDLQYHELGTGLFQMLQQKGLVERLVSDEEIKHATLNPPADTRASIRGKAVAKGIYVTWHSITLGLTESRCQGCQQHCKRTEGGRTINIDNPLHNYSELETKLESTGRR